MDCSHRGCNLAAVQASLWETSTFAVCPVVLWLSFQTAPLISERHDAPGMVTWKTWADRCPHTLPCVHVGVPGHTHLTRWQQHPSFMKQPLGILPFPQTTPVYSSKVKKKKSNKILLLYTAQMKKLWYAEFCAASSYPSVMPSYIHTHTSIHVWI